MERGRGEVVAGDDHDHVDGKDGGDIADDGDLVTVEDVRILIVFMFRFCCSEACQVLGRK